MYVNEVSYAFVTRISYEDLFIKRTRRWEVKKQSCKFLSNIRYFRTVSFAAYYYHKMCI